MFKFKLILIRTIASLVFFCRSKDLSDSRIKFIVCTGSVGKTIIRRSLVDSLSVKAESKFVTPKTDYCNELGVILAILEIEDFSFFSYSSWVKLFLKKPLKDKFIFIELGADFRLDIQWFLGRWSPYDVILTQATEIPWTKEISKVLASRIKLCRAVTGGEIYISCRDNVHLKILRENKIPFILINHDQDIYSYPSQLLINYCEQEIETTFIPFLTKRYTRFSLGKGVLIKDTHKVTPVCLAHFLNKLLIEETKEKILIMTEIRPVISNYEEVYKNFIPDLQLVDKIYFYGDKKVYLYLIKKLNNLIWVEKQDIQNIVLNLRRKLSEDSVTVGIKISSFYELSPLEKLSN